MSSLPAASRPLSRHPAGSWLELLAIAWPLVISQGSQTVMYVTDRLFLTWVSTDALAAAMPASFAHWLVLSLFMGTSYYAGTFVAQYEGAGKKDRVIAATMQGVYFALAAGLILAPVGLLSDRFFLWLGHGPTVARLEGQYFSVVCFGSMPMLLSSALSGFFTGRGKTYVVMAVSAIAALTNVGLDYLMIFGKGPFPRMEVYGAALATVLASVVGAVCYAVLLVWYARRDGYPLNKAGFDRELFQRLLRFGLPGGLHWLVDVAGWGAFLQCVALLGTTHLAATNLAFNLNSLAFVPLLGMGMAVSTIVGHRVGERRPALARRSVWMALTLALGYTLAFAAVYLFLPEVILAPYRWQNDSADFAEVEQVVIGLLRFVAVYSFFDCLAVIFAHAIRGAGDTAFAMRLTLVCAGGLLALPTWSLRYFDAGLAAMWGVATFYVMVMGACFMLRFMSGKWERMSVIEQPGDDDNVPSGDAPSDASREPFAAGVTNE